MKDWIKSPAPHLLLPDLKGKSFLVTGTSKGIGASVAEALLENGAKVFGLARHAGAIKDEKFQHLRSNLSDSADIVRTLGEIRGLTDSLDGVVNVAGADPKYPLETMTIDQWDHLLDLNLRAYWVIIKESLPLLLNGQNSSVVNVSSINYRLGVSGRAAYAASKAGILGLTTGLSRELGAKGIRVNTVTPGWTFTERQTEEYFSGESEAKYLAYLEDRQSLKLQVQSRDIANHILFYLSAVSRASTGHNCVVDGGWLLE